MYLYEFPGFSELKKRVNTNESVHIIVSSIYIYHININYLNERQLELFSNLIWAIILTIATILLISN